MNMNIFILDLDFKRCAQYHCDKHVIKMILEGVQIICSALHLHGHTTPYRPTHQKHPCVLWVAESYENLLWTQELMLALNEEYRYRWQRQKDHASIEVLRQIRGKRYANNGLTEFVQAMPEQYRVPQNAVAAYRRYYIAEKLKFATWKHRPEPPWIEKNEIIYGYSLKKVLCLI